MLGSNVPGNLNPHVSVDCVVFGFEFGKLNVLLIERNMQFEGREYKDLKLPGDLVRMDEDLDTAASRVLSELTGLDNIYLKQFAAIGSPVRLLNQPRDMAWLRSIGHPEEIVVTVAYYSLINIDQDKSANFTIQSNARWYPVPDVGELAFDHLSILHHALQELRTDLRLKPIAFELLPPKFTLRQLQQVANGDLGTPQFHGEMNRDIEDQIQVVCRRRHGLGGKIREYLRPGWHCGYGGSCGLFRHLLLRQGGCPVVHAIGRRRRSFLLGERRCPVVGGKVFLCVFAHRLSPAQDSRSGPLSTRSTFSANCPFF